MALHFIRAGLQTSIQDSGRQHQMHHGISTSGAMDKVSMKLANWLVSNPLDAATIEITLSGPLIQFSQPMVIGICGAPFEVTLNDRPIAMNRSIQIQAGDSLNFKKRITGCRCYLAISGIISVPEIFSSYSTQLTAAYGGLEGRALRDLDQLNVTVTPAVPIRTLSEDFQPNYSGDYLLRCVPSVETELFSSQALAQFQQQTWSVTNQSNRMGTRLTGQPLSDLPQTELVSSGLLPASIQLPPSGLPIISGADGQTTGGYPRIANVIRADMPLLGQLKTSDALSFVMVSRQQARAIYHQQLFLIKKLMQAPSI